MFSQPKKTQDGRYYVKPVESKLVQLNGVKIVSISQDNVTLSLNQENQSIISAIDASNIESAKANCESWFSRVIQEKTIEAAYVKSFTDDGVMNVNKPSFHRVYRAKELVEDQPADGEVCDVVIDFSGISFSKKTFTPVWKIVQTRLKVPLQKKYPEEYLFQDEELVEVSDEDFF
jgi:hypothetical protein